MASPSLSPESEDGKITSITNAGITWTEVVDPTQAETAILARDYHFHPLDLDSCLSTLQLTKMEDHDDHFFIMLQIPNQGSQGIIGCKQVSMFLGKDYLVTLHPSSLKSVSALFQSCRDDEKERTAIMKSSAYLAYRIIDNLADGISAILDNVQTDLNKIEAVVFDEKKSSARVINLARRQITVLRRIVYPLDLYIGDLSEAQKFSKEDMKIYFSDTSAQSRENLCENRRDEGNCGDLQRHRLCHEQQPDKYRSFVLDADLHSHPPCRHSRCLLRNEHSHSGRPRARGPELFWNLHLSIFRNPRYARSDPDHGHVLQAPWLVLDERRHGTILLRYRHEK